VTENKVIVKRTATEGVFRLKLRTCEAVVCATDAEGGDD